MIQTHVSVKLIDIFIKHLQSQNKRKNWYAKIIDRSFIKLLSNNRNLH